MHGSSRDQGAGSRVRGFSGHSLGCGVRAGCRQPLLSFEQTEAVTLRLCRKLADDGDQDRTRDANGDSRSVVALGVTGRSRLQDKSGQWSSQGSNGVDKGVIRRVRESARTGSQGRLQAL